MQFFPFALAFNPQSLLTIGMLVLVVVVFYFLLIRPQKKQEKEAQRMRDNMKVGDEVTTIGGIVGKIVSLKDETVVIETTKDKTHIRFLRAAIRSVDVVAEDSHPIVHETPAEPAPEEVIEETPAPEATSVAPAPADNAEATAADIAPETTADDETK